MDLIFYALIVLIVGLHFRSLNNQYQRRKKELEERKKFLDDQMNSF
jgi:glucose uptake protein GlcU